MTLLDPALSQRALSARVPRYTSYPPATRFTDQIGPAQSEAWLQSLPVDARISLYFHIPFCRRLCWFCACRTQGSATEAPLAPYLDTLEAEMDLVAAQLPAGVTVGHLHIGGGTPTFLPPALLRRLFDALAARFTLAEDADIAIEVDPTEIDGPRLDALAACGVTRASLGVQDFDPNVQEAIGRKQSIRQTKRAIDGLRQRGVEQINLDLLYGLPRQTGARLARTLETVVRLGPDRLALYGYAHVPWASKRQVMIPEADLPDAGARLSLTRAATEYLVQAGYQAIGIDHFARPDDPMAVAARAGTLRRNFQGYTCDRADSLIGLGASAISHLPGGYAQNAARTGDWKARIQSGRIATVRGHALTAEDRLRGRMIERLLCELALSPVQFGNRADARRLCEAILRDWPDAVDRQPGGGFRVRQGAELLARLIAHDLDAYDQPVGRHSLAV